MGIGNNNNPENAVECTGSMSGASGVDYEILCDTNGLPIAVIYDLSDPESPVSTLWDITNNALYVGAVGDLSECSGNKRDVEQSLVCDIDTTQTLTQFTITDTDDGSFVGVYYLDGLGAPFVPTGGVSFGACVAPDALQTVSYTDCSGVVQEVDVDSTVGAYLLNQDYSHYQTLYDNIQREISGDILLDSSSTVIEIDMSTIAGINVSVTGTYIDFGTGHTEVLAGAGVFFYDTANILPGKYEVKIFSRYDDNGREINILIGDFEYTKPLGGNPFWISGAVQSASRTWTATDAAFIRGFCGDDVSGIHGDFNVDGTPYVAAGTPSLSEILVHDELIDHAVSSDLITSNVLLYASSRDIASGIYSAALGSDGASWSPTGNVTSITIHAKHSDVDYTTIDVGRNQVTIGTYGGGPTVLEEGQTVTFSAEDGNNVAIGDITCVNDAAAQIFYTIRI